MLTASCSFLGSRTQTRTQMRTVSCKSSVSNNFSWLEDERSILHTRRSGEIVTHGKMQFYSPWRGRGGNNSQVDWWIRNNSSRQSFFVHYIAQQKNWHFSSLGKLSRPYFFHIFYWKCKFPMTRSVRLTVCWSVDWSVGLSVIIS